MTPKPKPTNTDLQADIKEIKTMLLRQGESIRGLEIWRISQEVSKKAVEEYRTQEDSERRNKLSEAEIKSKTEVFLKLAPLLGTLGLLAAYLLSRTQ